MYYADVINTNNYFTKDDVKRLDFSQRCMLLYEFLIGHIKIDKSNCYTKNTKFVAHDKTYYVDPDDFVYYIHFCFDLKRYVSQDKQTSIYVKNNKTHVYELLDFHIKMIIQSTLNYQYNHPIDLFKVKMKLRDSLNFTANEIVDRLSADIENLKQIDLVDQQKYVVFKNGIYKRDDLVINHKTAQAEIVQFDVINQLQANYLTYEEFNHHDNDRYRYVLETLLSNWFGNLKIVGLNVMRSVFEKDHRRKGILLYGDGDNGKSSFIQLLIKCVGHQNVEQVDLHKLSDKRSIGSIKSHTSLIYSTESVKFINDRSWRTLKRLIDGTKVESFVKFKGNRYIRSTATLIFATNSKTQIPKNDSQLERRLIALSFMPSNKQNRDESIDFDSYLNDQLFIEYVINYVFRHTINFEQLNA